MGITNRFHCPVAPTLIQQNSSRVTLTRTTGLMCRARSEYPLFEITLGTFMYFGIMLYS